jgi:hypothetical protein
MAPEPHILGSRDAQVCSAEFSDDGVVGNRMADNGSLPFRRPADWKWISKSRGLPLRHEFDLDSGEGRKKQHSSP